MKLDTRLASVCLVLASCARSPVVATGASSATATMAEDICFGGVPEVLATDVGAYSTDMASRNAKALHVGGGNLFWPTRAGAERMDLASRVRSHVRFGPYSFFKTGDDREGLAVAFAREGDLIASDLRNGAQRTVVTGAEREIGVSHDSLVQLDGDFVYFIRSNTFGRFAKETGFFRARRDGPGEPERIGSEPQGGFTPFLVEREFVYWNRDNGEGGPALWRRALVPNSPVTRLVSTKRHHIPFTLDGGRLYFLDGAQIASIPVDGSAAPAVHVNDAGPSGSSLVATGGCLYWTNDRAIMRARLDGKSAPEILANEADYRGGPVVSDGRHLYWMDRANDRIVRVGKGSRALAAATTLLAKPIDTRFLPPDAPEKTSTVVVGDGWGCARVFGWHQPQWQCWSAPAGTAKSVPAQRVPWLSADDLPIGPDRLCSLDENRAKCWPWPTWTRQRPVDLPAWQTRDNKLGHLLVGGTFACAMQHIGAERMLLCSGDDSFGQLAQQQQPEMLERWHGALGTWHGCVASLDVRDMYCWGRGDAGQLGFAPLETCPVGGQRIACSHDARATPFGALGATTLLAGDMFTCALRYYGQALLCWGGSRDGWLGETPCSDDLRAAWPVPSGSVPAPNSTCSTNPVKLPGFAGQVRSLSAGPRGLCAVVDGKVRCIGAIPTPSQEVSKVEVSRGTTASACGIAGSRVLCWGEGYSPTDRPDLPVAVAFASSVPVSAVLDSPPPAGEKWSDKHLFNRGCDRTPAVLPLCAAGARGEPWAAIAPKAASLRGKTVSVRDRLVVGPFADNRFQNTSCTAHEGNAQVREDQGNDGYPGTTLLGCYRYRRHIVLGEGEHQLRFREYPTRFDCIGDESRLCCGAQAFGQTVIATGELSGSDDGGWGLKAATVCQVSTH